MTNAEQLAFPMNELRVYGPNPGEPICTHYGLTKREYFAGVALQGLLAEGSQITEADSIAGYAHDAVRFADALLAALNAEKEHQSC